MSDDPRLEILRSLLGQSYRIESYLGRGGSARVYTVTNLRLGRLEALKVLSETPIEGSDFAQRFANEARMAASLDHPNIVKVYDFGEHEGIFWYTMQLIEGPSLAAELRSRTTFDEADAARLVLPLLDALDYSHERGIVHRDIKPSNVIIDAHGRPYLMDFGIAKSVDSLLKTKTGLVLGTPAYVAPEQAANQTLDGRADLYALGVTLFQMACGAFPFTAPNPLQTVIMRMSRDPDPLRSKLPEVDPRFEEIVMCALARDRDDRFATAGAMRAQLADFVGEVEDLAVPPVASGAGRGQPLKPTEPSDLGSSPTIAVTSGSEAQRLSRLRQRRALRPLLGLAAVAVMIAVVVVAYLGLRGAGDESPVGAAVPADPLVVAIPTATRVAVAAESTVVATAAPGQPTQPAREVMPAAPTPTRPPPPRRVFEQPVLKVEGSAKIASEVAATCAGTTVNLSLWVATDGSVESTKVISTGHEVVCSEAAREAVSTYAFAPGKDVDGVPIRARLYMAFTFEKVGDHGT